MIRVAIFEDYKILRDGLYQLINGTEGLCCSGAFPDCNKLIKNIEQSKPDVVLMDYNMPLMDGVEATRHIQKDHPEISVIGLSIHERGGIENAMRKAGAIAYCQKGCPTDELLSAIRECSDMKSL